MVAAVCGTDNIYLCYLWRSSKPFYFYANSAARTCALISKQYPQKSEIENPY